MSNKGYKRCPNCGRYKNCTCRASKKAMTAIANRTRKPDATDRILKRKSQQPPHVIIEARAGTGKTTTLVEGLKVLRGQEPRINPSPQQQAVWDAIVQSPEGSSACFVAFTKSIATELQGRVPSDCDAKTIHSLGYAAVRQVFGSVEPNSFRVSDLIAEILETDIRELRRKKFGMLCATEKLVGLCKLNLVKPTEENLAGLAAYYDVDLDGSQAEVFALVPQVLERCKDVRDRIDFNDMVWLPVVLNLPLPSYDLLLVDEAQDLNRCQQTLVMRAGKRMVFCGDPKQAIYGFAGADCESMERLQKQLEQTNQGCVHLPLTVTRRCGKAIVKEAQKLVPDFEAHESNATGLVHKAKFEDQGKAKTAELSRSSYTSYAGDGDMIICRVNAPLVSQCFRFIKQGRKANIQGRDIGQDLISTVKKSKATTVEQLVSWIGDWLNREQRKENAKRNPSDARLIALQDRHDCLLAFTEEATTTVQVTEKIEDIFLDKANGGILLSSVHKAKGLEANRVFILLPPNSGMPHPMAKSGWARKQEYNLKYVAITRAIEELVWVS